MFLVYEKSKLRKLMFYSKLNFLNVFNKRKKVNKNLIYKKKFVRKKIKCNNITKQYEQ